MGKPSFSGRMMRCLGCDHPVRVVGSKGAKIEAPDSCSHCKSA